MDFHDLDFVGAPAALGPSKSGVGCLDCVGQKKSSSNAMFLVLSIQAVLVFPRNVPTKSEAPTPPGQFFWAGIFFICIYLYTYMYVNVFIQINVFVHFLKPAFPLM